MTFLFEITEEKKVDNTKIILQLEKAAGSCFAKAEKISTEVNGPWTRKRQAQADSNAKKKDRYYKWGRILTALATMWENNNIPPLLTKIRTATDLETVFWSGYPSPPEKDHPIDGWYRQEYPARLAKALKVGMRNKDEASEMGFTLNLLGEEKLTPEKEKAMKLREELKKVHTYNIPGFFPTPDELIDVMIEHAEIEPFHYIFEPSAGIGSIVDRITKDRQDQPYPAQGIDCCELYPSLAYILMLKGYTVISNDFNSAIGPLNGYDRIIMNPPFEKGQDMEHVMICFHKFLKRGGRLVSVMSTSAITGSNKIHQQFKQFREDHRAYYIENGAAFKNAFNSTGTHSIILVVDKEK
jgi:hypothetical protein